MIKFFEKLLSLIYVQSCYFCHSTKEDTLFCSECYSKIKFLPPACLTSIDGCEVYSAALYEGIIKTLIKSLKYYNQKQLAFYQAKIIFDYWQKLNINKNFLILPVPIHKNRLRERKYNHMDLVADEFSKLTGFKVNKNFLIRIKDTKKQYTLHRTERLQNLKGAFAINSKSLPLSFDSELLIIDDITSTGATLKEIIYLLKSNGYKKISALTLATPDIWN